MEFPIFFSIALTNKKKMCIKIIIDVSLKIR